MSIENILLDCNLPFTRYETVTGGDINQCYCIFTNSDKYFLKVNDAVLFPGMLEKEARGLQALQDANSGVLIPGVFKTGTIGIHQYLLLEWIPPGKPGEDNWYSFGRSLGRLHKNTSAYFGWTEDNYIGNLPQLNTPSKSWSAFYAEYRLFPLAGKLFESGQFSRDDLHRVENCCARLEQLFPTEPPAFLHGDCWSGNFLFRDTGKAVFFDPAVYYGHREMDLGMSRLFGGFDQPFYEGYNDCYPLEPLWEERLPLSQLYPLLVHALLFGASYNRRCKDIVKKFGG